MPLPGPFEAREYSSDDSGSDDGGSDEGGSDHGGADDGGRRGEDDLDPERIEAPTDAAAGAIEPAILVAGDEADGGRLDKWLASRMPDHSRARLQRWIADGRVVVGDGRVVAARDRVWQGDRVRVDVQPDEAEAAFAAEDIALDVVHEDAAILVVDKRAGLVVHPAAGHWSGTLLNGLLHRDPALAAVSRAGIVHRLDKDTSGLMVVARTAVAQTDLVRQLQARTVGRTYLAFVHGRPPATGRVALAIGRDPRDRLRMAAFDDDRPGTRPAATRFRTLAGATVAAGRTVSLVVCRLETGRTHQIRVHLRAIGHPLVGDALYGGAGGPIAFGRQALHAWRLALVHPTTRRPMRWRSEPPADLAALAVAVGIDLASASSTVDDDD